MQLANVSMKVFGRNFVAIAKHTYFPTCPCPISGIFRSFLLFILSYNPSYTLIDSSRTIGSKLVHACLMGNTTKYDPFIQTIGFRPFGIYALNNPRFCQRNRWNMFPFFLGNQCVGSKLVGFFFLLAIDQFIGKYVYWD